MSMLLKGRNGNEFELDFIRESLADVQDGTGDSNWATVTFRVATSDESWEETAPCLNLFEFQGLADWLEGVGHSRGAAAPALDDNEATKTAIDAVVDEIYNDADLGEAEMLADEIDPADDGDISEVELLEPELKFSVSQQFEDAVTIRVGFHLADRPEEFNVDSQTDEAAYIDLHMSRRNILAAAQALRSSIDDLNLQNLKDAIHGEDDGGLEEENNAVDQVVIDNTDFDEELGEEEREARAE